MTSWVAIQSYPWNWVPIVDQHKDDASGYFFGIDAEGRLGLQLSVWGVWQVCRSDVRVPLQRWTHVAAVYDPKTGVSLYIDGKPAGKLPITGDFVSAERYASPHWKKSKRSAPGSSGASQSILPCALLLRRDPRRSAYLRSSSFVRRSRLRLNPSPGRRAA